MAINHQSQAPLVDNVKYSNLSSDTLLLVPEKTVVFFPFSNQSCTLWQKLGYSAQF